MSIFERYKRNEADKKHREAVGNANDYFQICENNGEIWLLYNGSLICPCSMLKDEPVEAINKMRELYIKQNG